jgi:hypothetical protein
MDTADNHIRRFAEIEAADDAAAADLAKVHEGEMALELWSLNRKVLRMEPAPEAQRRPPAAVSV